MKNMNKLPPVPSQLPLVALSITFYSERVHFVCFSTRLVVHFIFALRPLTLNVGKVSSDNWNLRNLRCNTKVFLA